MSAPALGATGAEITRRGFVGRAAAAVVGIACAGPGEPVPAPLPEDGAERIVVAGAGLAGLAAAVELVRLGHQVVVLEARSRPGGRVHTLRGVFADGLHAEAGAAFVTDRHRHVLDHVREFGVRLAASGARRGGGERYFIAGRYLNQSAEAAGEDATVASLRARLLGPLLDQVGDPRREPWPPPAAWRMDDETLAGLLLRRGASAHEVALLSLGYLSEWGDGPAHCSALSMLRDLAQLRGTARVWRIAEGSDRLPLAMAARLGGRVHYGCAVTSIRQRAGTVRVAYLDGAEPRELGAARAICALPFPVLRTLRVAPPFTAAKRAVVDTLRTTSVCRVFLQVSSRRWDPASASVVTDLPLMLVADATPGQAGPRAVLEAFVTGPQARRLAAMDPAARTRLVTALAERLHPRLRGAVERIHCYAWDHDRWARGDYAWFAPGELRAFRSTLAAPEGAIHFAGDHTSALPGWMEGALASGVRAASEVHASLSHAGV